MIFETVFNISMIVVVVLISIYMIKEKIKKQVYSRRILIAFCIILAILSVAIIAYNVGRIIDIYFKIA